MNSTFPPLVGEMTCAAAESVAALRAEIRGVRLAPYDPECPHERITFHFRGTRYVASLRGRNADIMPDLDPDAEANRSLALRCLLDGDASPWPPLTAEEVAADGAAPLST